MKMLSLQKKLEEPKDLTLIRMIIQILKTSKRNKHEEKLFTWTYETSVNNVILNPRWKLLYLSILCSTMKPHCREIVFSVPFFFLAGPGHYYHLQRFSSCIPFHLPVLKLSLISLVWLLLIFTDNTVPLVYYYCYPQLFYLNFCFHLLDYPMSSM